MAGGSPTRLNVAAQKARNDINLMMSEVVESFDLIKVSHVIMWTPPPMRGGPAQYIDIISNIFVIHGFQIPNQRVFDCTDQAIGAYQAELRKLRRKLFNPLYWVWVLLISIVQSPSRISRNVKDSWGGWNRAEKLALISIIVAVIIGVVALMSTEVRQKLGLDKTVPVQTSPAQVKPDDQKSPAVTALQPTAPEKNKPTHPKTTATKVAPPTVINAQGGIPIVGNQGTVNNPTVNNFGPPPPPTPTVTICITHPNLPEGTGHKTVLTFKTDVEIMESWYALFFDGPVGEGSVELASASYGYTHMRADKMPKPENSFVFRNTSINFGAARWLPNAPLTVTIPSKDPVNLVKIMSGSGEGGREEVFVYRCD